jgi:hypothetical protein
MSSMKMIEGACSRAMSNMLHTCQGRAGHRHHA